MDTALFHFIHGFAGRWPFLDWIGIFSATHLEYILIGTATVMAFWPPEHMRRWKRVGRVALLAMLGSYVVFKVGIPMIFQRGRPFVTLDEVQQLITIPVTEYYHAFPSGHAVRNFAIAWVIHQYDRRVGKWFLLGALLIAISRVFVGVHWPSDIIIGALLGIIGATVARWKVDRYPHFWNRFLS